MPAQTRRRGQASFSSAKHKCHLSVFWDFLELSTQTVASAEFPPTFAICLDFLSMDQMFTISSPEHSFAS
jgi:hypothetical protein